MKTLKISQLCLVGIMVLGVMAAYISFAPQTLSASELIGGCPTGDCKGTTDLVNCMHILPTCCSNYVIHLCEWQEDGPGLCAPTGLQQCWGPGDCSKIQDQKCNMLQVKLRNSFLSND